MTKKELEVLVNQQAEVINRLNELMEQLASNNPTPKKSRSQMTIEEKMDADIIKDADKI